VSLKILHLEDNERDAILIEDLLNQHHVPCTCLRVETEAEFRAALAREKQLDLVLADLSLPTFDGKSAMQILSRDRPHVPFIFVSGTLGEESAIESIKLGATDYVLKSRLSRLPLAVERAVAEARERNNRRQLEQQLLCVQRLEGFGMIAAGITHDLKNLLHPVKFASCLIQEECEGRVGTAAAQPQNKKLLELATLIRSSADRGIEMVDQVMGLFRVAEKRPQRLDVAGIVTQLADLIGSAYPALEVITELGPRLPAAYGQPHEIHQALLNLAMNARDAMKGKGRLWIGAASVQLDEAFFTPDEPGNPGEYLHLWVRDSGPGIPEALLQRIFEPLFTTKKDGAGTGLGLVSVTIIVRNHRGYSRVSNIPGGGAQFDLYFRGGQKEAEPEPEAGPAAPSEKLPTGSGEKIGIIADEASLRAALQDILTSYGYEIRMAENSARALQALEAEAVDLMILDWEPSLLGGPETARLLRLRRPVPIILTTTNPALQLDDGLKKLGIGAVLHRPFDTGQLLRAMEEVLAVAAGR